jgi:hypothetical protein
LRALHIVDCGRRNSKLSEIYHLLTGRDPPASLPEDLRELAKVLKFILPPVVINDIDKLKKMNEQMQLFIESA